MNMPGFTAEASLYQTSVHYVGSNDVGCLSNGTVVSPQGCGPIKNILCNSAALGCGICFPLLALPAAAACYLGCLGLSLFLFCRDCLGLLDVPGGGGGGSGPRPCPKCCEWDQEGKCRLCIPRNAVCP